METLPLPAIPKYWEEATATRFGLKGEKWTEYPENDIPYLFIYNAIWRDIRG
jgi:hypothetical protein